MTADDSILPFQLDRSDIRGRIVRLDGALGQILEQHDYPPAVEALVAEMALLTALIGQTIKLRWKLSLQVQSDGPVGMIATDYHAPAAEGAPATIRAYAKFDPTRLDDRRPFDQLGKGYFAVLIDQGAGTTPYRGLTSIAGNSLADCAESYFAQSEQLPTRFALAFGLSHEKGVAPHWRAGGIMLQHMPANQLELRAEKESPLAMPGLPTAASDESDEDWNRAGILLASVDAMELTGPSVTPETVLYRLFHEETPRVFDAQPVAFGCTCSEDRVRQSLSIYSAKDIEKMTTEEGTVTADCQFCGAHYVLDPKSVGFEATDG